jgi:hypothetical protein
MSSDLSFISSMLMFKVLYACLPTNPFKERWGPVERFILRLRAKRIDHMGCALEMSLVMRVTLMSKVMSMSRVTVRLITTTSAKFSLL